ncbi:MAG: hypothetical protein PF795_01515, partial [Kiritimatiellae bacterium]|nr:hypothetical protein [Kiritimatiellia bacterium]
MGGHEKNENKKMKHKYILLLAALGLATASSRADLWINEFHYDNTGADTGEFVEVFVSSSFTGNLTDIDLLLYNGSDNVLFGSSDNLNLGSDFT